MPSDQLSTPSIELAKELIDDQFPEYTNLLITDVEKQGHDNRTYRLGNDMLIRMPTAKSYALKIPIEYELLISLAKHLTVSVPIPIKIGIPSINYPYPFSVYKYLPGTSLNLVMLEEKDKEQLAFDLAKFLKELQSITNLIGPAPGEHNWWRGDHISVYNQGAREQIALLDKIIDSNKAMDLWEQACATQWEKPFVWIHGDFAIGNILIENNKLSAVIDFGGSAIGDPACDLVIAWTYFTKKARDIFTQEIELDKFTWLRARAWALWKATFELCQIEDRSSIEAYQQRIIIEEIIK